MLKKEVDPISSLLDHTGLSGKYIYPSVICPSVTKANSL